MPTRAWPDTLTWLLALALVLAVAIGGSVSALVRYDMLGVGHLPRVALYPVFIMLLLNAAAAALGRRRWFSQQRMMYVYVAVLAMANLPGIELVTRQHLMMVAAQGYSTPGDRVAEDVLPYVPGWLVPSTDPDSPVVRYAFRGVPYGGAMPWRDWLRPLLAWTPVFLATLALQMTLPALLRRRWADQERLLFPLARIPVELAQYSDERSGVPVCFRSRLFWAALAVPPLIYTLNALHDHFPTWPELRLQRDFGRLFASRPWTALNFWPCNLYFEMTGVTYLVPDEMGFSLWFFWVARRLVTVGREACGLFGHDSFFREQGFGAYGLLLGGYLWTARHSLKSAWRKALLDDPAVDDTGEPMSYRAAVWGSVAALGVCLLWAHVAGASAGYTAVGVALYVIMVTVITRLVAEGGVFIAWPPMERFNHHLVRLFGAQALGRRTITALSYLGLKLADPSTSTMANLLTGYKIADLGGLSRRGATTLVAVALVLALLACHPAALWTIYSRSIPGLGWFPRVAYVDFGRDIVWQMHGMERFGLGSYTNMAVGATVTLLLRTMRQAHVWWPFHPLGYVAIIGPPYLGDRYGFSILCGWALRRLVQRLGGHRAYRLGRDAALGLVVGNAVALVTWSLLATAWPLREALIVE